MALRAASYWRKSGRCVYADSFFASVHLAELLYKKFNMFFTGVVKQCSARFPKRVLETIGVIPGLSIELIALL